MYHPKDKFNAVIRNPYSIRAENAKKIPFNRKVKSKVKGSSTIQVKLTLWADLITMTATKHIHPGLPFKQVFRV